LSESSRYSSVASPIPVSAGIGLRFAHHRQVLETTPAVAWFEVHSENFFGGGTVRQTLLNVRRHYPLSLHGVGLSLGSAEGLDAKHLQRLAELVRIVEPALISEHLSWSVVGGDYLADLLPLPMTEEALQVVCRHVQQMQEGLRRQILIENPSTYLQFPHSSIPEWEFIAEVARRSGCGLLCDVNNIYVSARNHDWDADLYLKSLPADAVGELHLAGHAVRRLDSGRTIRIDDHGSRVAPEVWSLYEQALRMFGPKPTLIEWDTDVPAFEVLLEEAGQANERLRTAHRSHACAA
jgi:uncharacterized protein (UPF0276 family)